MSSKATHLVPTLVALETLSGATTEVDSVHTCLHGDVGKMVHYRVAYDGIYEPGSTFKAVSMLAALESGKINPDQIIDTEGGVKIYHGRKMEDDHVYKDGFLTVREVFEQSSNVGTSKIIYNLYYSNPEEFIKTLK